MVSYGILYGALGGCPRPAGSAPMQRTVGEPSSIRADAEEANDARTNDTRTINVRTTNVQTTNVQISDLLSRMTLEEKVGQLNLISADLDRTGPSMETAHQDDIKRGRIGAIFNAYGAEFTHKLQAIAVEQTRLGIPLLFGYDVVHGFRTIFPVPLGEAASWNLETMERSARIAAIEMAAAGVHWTFAPMVDIARDPRWGRVVEGAGEDPFLASRIAAARVRGFQGRDLSRPDTVLACAKHFAAYGAAQAGRDYFTVDISERSLHETYLPPFYAAVEAGVGTIMTAFHELSGVPATSHPYLLKRVLRDAWRFSGFVVSDYTAVAELIPHGVAPDLREATRLAFGAGVDMDMQDSAFLKELPKLVRTGRVSERDIDQAVRRVLVLKTKLGLFDDPYRYHDPARERSMQQQDHRRATARDAARRSIVLLKNEGALPIESSRRRIAVIGPLANARDHALGSWHAQGKADEAISLLQGIRAQAPATMNVTHALGCSIDGDENPDFSEAIRVARTADRIVLALGESATMSGEAASRSEIDLPGAQRDLFLALRKLRIPIIVVLMNGRPLAIPELAAHADAIVETWFGGSEAGNAIADVLFGRYNPSGKLPVTFPRSVGQVPIFYNHKNSGRPPKPGDHYRSRYLDSPTAPLYPFGHGLSYSTFRYGEVRLGHPDLRSHKLSLRRLAQTPLRVTVRITNTGSVRGEDVAQLYIRDLVGSVTRPVQELRGFRRVSLEPGQSTDATFDITPAALAFYRRDMSVGVEPGEFTIMVGPSSAQVKRKTFRLVVGR